MAHLVGHAEDVVDVSHELQGAHDLLLDLVLAAEDVCVVLAETPHAGETRQGSAQLKKTTTTKDDLVNTRDRISLKIKTELDETRQGSAQLTKNTHGNRRPCG